MSGVELADQVEQGHAGVVAAAGLVVESAAEQVERRHTEAKEWLERGRPVLAERAAKAGLALARRAGLAAEQAQLRLVLAWTAQQRGDSAASTRLLDRVEPALDGLLLARARCLRGLNLCVAGDYPAAVLALDDAVVGLADDRHWLANALVGRGVVNGYLRRFAAADHDLARAHRLYLDGGAVERAATCLHNRGFVAMAAGDVVGALDFYAGAAERGLADSDRPEAMVDRAHALLVAGLVTDAGLLLAEAADRLGAAGRGPACAEALLAHAQAVLRGGDHRSARRLADRALRLFTNQGRERWVVVARSVALRARLALGKAATRGVLAQECSGLAGSVARRRSLPDVDGLAMECEAAGWPVEAAELRLAAGQYAAVAVLRRSRSAQLRALGWLAWARLAGDRPGALAACRAGLRVVEEYAAALDAVELRAGSGELASALAATGLAAALDGGKPSTVLAWTERYRAAALWTPPVRPPADPRLAAALDDLRASETPEAEAAVRAAALAVDARGARARELVAPQELPLGDAVLVSFVVHNGRMCAITVADGRIRRHDLGNGATPIADAESLRFSLSFRMRSGRARTAACHTAERLDRALFGKLRSALGDRPLVVIPAEGLHQLPWSALPTCAGRPVSVAPSAAVWARAARQPVPVGEPVWVAGPGLPYADREVKLLHRRWGGTLLRGRESTVDSTLRAMDGAGMVHIAAHGRFRDDAPLFSALELSDGMLYGYDLDRLHRAPRWVILSACDSALGVPRPGDQVLSMATVLLRRGTSALIASTIQIPDDQAKLLMTTLHTELRAGYRPAEALARAQVLHGHLGFVCLGAG